MNKSDSYRPSPDQPALPSAFTLFQPSWQAVRLNLVTILEFTLLPILLNIGLFLLLRQSGESSFMDSYRLAPNQLHFGLGYFVSLGATGLITLILMPALNLTYLKGAKGQKVTLWEAFKDSLPLWWRYIGLLIVYGLAMLGGFILLIVPGVIVLQRLLLAGYFLLDRDLSIRQAIKTSWQASKRYSGSVWGLIGVTLLLEIAISLVGRSNYFLQILSQLVVLVYACAPAVRYLQIKQADKAA